MTEKSYYLPGSLRGLARLSSILPMTNREIENFSMRYLANDEVYERDCKELDNEKKLSKARRILYEACGHGIPEKRKKLLEKMFVKYVATIMGFRSTKDEHPKRLKQVGEELGKLERLSNSLKEFFENISNETLALIVGDEEGHDVLPTLEESLPILVNVVTRLQGSLPADPGGRPREIFLEDFTQRLSELWRTMTGRRASITWNDYAQSYEGKFLKFVWFSCDLAGVRYHNVQALGDRIKRLTSKPTPRDPQE